MNDINFAEKERYKYFLIRNIYEAPKNLFIKFKYLKKDYLAIYNKTSNETKISKLDNDQYGQIHFDIDDFCPFDLYSINNNGELVGMIEAFKIEEWFDLNPENAKDLPQKLFEFSNIKDEDNPVIIIAKIK